MCHSVSLVQSCAAAREANARRVAAIRRVSTGFSGLYSVLDCYGNMIAMDPSGRRRTCIPTATVASMAANSTCLDKSSRAAIMVSCTRAHVARGTGTTAQMCRECKHVHWYVGNGRGLGGLK